MLGNTYVRIVNNFLHDMATGLWIASLAVIVILAGRLDAMPAEAAVALGDAMWVVFWLMIAGLVVVTVTGALRLVYWRAETVPEEMAEKRTSLIVKHVAFFVIYGGGSIWGWLLLP